MFQENWNILFSSRLWNLCNTESSLAPRTTHAIQFYYVQPKKEQTSLIIEGQQNNHCELVQPNTAEYKSDPW